jgi:sulfite reductase alpha subunit-like flavoprotein
MTDSELGGFISTVEHPKARDRFRADLRRALVATASSEWSSTETAATRRRSPLSWPVLAAPRYALAFAVIVLAIFSASGVAAASSLPGDATYSLKQAYEDVELALAGDPAAKVRVLTVQSDRRLNEFNQVNDSHPERTDQAAAAYQRTLAKLQAALSALQAQQTGPSGDRDDQAANDAEDAAAKQITALESVKSDSNEVQKALEQAKDVQKKAKDKQKHNGQNTNDDPNQVDEQKNETRPADGATTPAQRTLPTPRTSPKTNATPRPDEHQGD